MENNIQMPWGSSLSLIVTGKVLSQSFSKDTCLSWNHMEWKQECFQWKEQQT